MSYVEFFSISVELDLTELKLLVTTVMADIKLERFRLTSWYLELL